MSVLKSELLKLSVSTLKKRCQRLNISKQGNKLEIIDRIIKKQSVAINSKSINRKQQNSNNSNNRSLQSNSSKLNNMDKILLVYGYIRSISTLKIPTNVSNLFVEFVFKSFSHDKVDRTDKAIVNHQELKGLTLHFVGIRRCESSKKTTLDLFNHYNINKNLVITINSDLQLNDTIQDLKQLIFRTYDIPSIILKSKRISVMNTFLGKDDNDNDKFIHNDIFILYSHSIISINNELTLKQCGITNNALLVVAICNSKNIDWSGLDATICNKFSTKPTIGYDIVFQESSGSLYKMPICGHLMSRNALYHYSMNTFKDPNNTYLTCMHPKRKIAHINKANFNKLTWKCLVCTFVNDSMISRCAMCRSQKPYQNALNINLCNQKWDYLVIKQILTISMPSSNIKLMELELLSARNKIQNECNVQKCPNCETLYFKNKSKSNWNNIQTLNDIENQFKTQCVLCDMNNLFCWCCGKIWENKHSCDPMFVLKKATVNILIKAETKTIGCVKKVPSIRCCPVCGELITHISACKHMKCRTCKTSFCFVCLELFDGVWKCGSYGDPCPVAPIQTMDSLPNIIGFVRQKFRLF